MCPAHIPGTTHRRDRTGALTIARFRPEEKPMAAGAEIARDIEDRLDIREHRTRCPHPELDAHQYPLANPPSPANRQTARELLGSRVQTGIGQGWKCTTSRKSAGFRRTG